MPVHSEKQSVALVSMLASAGLAIAKLVAGLLTGSLGILSEAVHSFTDFCATVITFFAVRLGDRERHCAVAVRDHQALAARPGALPPGERVVVDAFGPYAELADFVAGRVVAPLQTGELTIEIADWSGVRIEHLRRETVAS